MERYDVVWVNLFTGKIKKTRVLIVEGETTVADIPKIIACRYLTLSDASMVQVLERRPVS